jgi:hypothetical protein
MAGLSLTRRGKLRLLVVDRLTKAKRAVDRHRR